MGVSEADGDSRSYFRAGMENDPATRLPQKPYAVMADWVLEDIVKKAAGWQGGNVPEDFDPWNSWGGEFTARAMAMTNAESAQKELSRRQLERAANPPVEI